MNQIQKTELVKVGRLRAEAKHLGIDTTGKQRIDLIIELQEKGVFEVDLKFPAKPPKIDVTCRKDDLSNVYIGNGAGLYEHNSNQLHISNHITVHPLIGGDFLKKRVNIHDTLNITESMLNLQADTYGLEGDLRRDGSNLYMYRCTDVHSGWYPLLFGNVKII
jgi:hypothetical protein